MKIKVYVDGSQRNTEGEMTVYISVSHEGKRFMVNSGITTTEKFYGREFPRSVRNHVAKTSALNRRLLEVESFCLKNDGMEFGRLKEEVRLILGGAGVRRKFLADYVREFGSTKRAYSTQVLYDQTAKKVEAFDARATFDSIDEAWLSRFERYWLRTMQVNGLAIVLRNIRATFNWALKHRWTTNYPFWFFKIREEKTRKRCLTAQQFADLRDVVLEPWMVQYRDIFVLMVYLIGINAGDLLTLERLVDGRCVYHRAKTGRLYDIAVQPEAMKIINRYRGKKYLLSPMDSCREYAHYLHTMNDALKLIGKTEYLPDKRGNMMRRKRHPMFPELTSYWARHTWATIASKIGVQRDTIGAALGHADSKTADIYIDFDMSKVDEANRAVIDYLNSFRGSV